MKRPRGVRRLADVVEGVSKVSNPKAFTGCGQQGRRAGEQGAEEQTSIHQTSGERAWAAVCENRFQDGSPWAVAMNPFCQQVHCSAGEQQKFVSVASDGVEGGAMRSVTAPDNDSGSWLLANLPELARSTLSIEFHNLDGAVAKGGERLAQMLGPMRADASRRRIDHRHQGHEKMLSLGKFHWAER